VRIDEQCERAMLSVGTFTYLVLGLSITTEKLLERVVNFRHIEFADGDANNPAKCKYYSHTE